MIEIVVKEIGAKPCRHWGNTENMFEARVEGELLCRSRTPFLSAARKLQRRGVPDDTLIEMRHEGSSMVAMRATVGLAAGLTVREDNDGKMPPRFKPYKAFPIGAVRHPEPDQGSGAIGQRAD